MSIDVLFVCLHGAARSVLAARYLDALARQRGHDVRTEAAGLEPDPVVPAGVADGLRRDGIDLGDYRPRPLTPHAVAAAGVVVTLGCDLPAGVRPCAPVERWDDIPAVSEDFARARDALLARLPGLLERLAARARTGGRA